MPLYDYKCDACGAEFEVERPLGATGAVKCACGSSKTSKVFSAAGIVFKGSGFYVTDSKSKPAESKTSGKPVEAKTDGVKSDGPKSDGGKADDGVKPAAKSETPAKSSPER